MNFGNQLPNDNFYGDASASVIGGEGAGGTQAVVIVNPPAAVKVRVTV